MISIACGNPKYCMLFLSTADIFQNHLFHKIISGKPSERQKVWNQIRSSILFVLIWVKTVGKGYQPTTKVVTIKERVKFHSDGLTISMELPILYIKMLVVKISIKYDISVPNDCFNLSKQCKP